MVPIRVPGGMDRSRSRRLGFLATALVLAGMAAGCNLFGAGGPGSAAAELSSHLAQWQAGGPNSYSYTITMACFCPFNEPYRVTVENNVTTAVTAAGAPVDAQQVSFLPKTIPAVFKLVSDNLDAAKLTVRYDPTLGFPTSIDADPIANAVDDEFSMTITDFTPGP
jgi:hypothetical protein